ncbi:hypothetical protein APHAL10511_005319 [Amanita phalloides]|nr:hypothetical protein APHAL10511_005319 [Amanita phalloides]
MTVMETGHSETERIYNHLRETITELKELKALSHKHGSDQVVDLVLQVANKVQENKGCWNKFIYAVDDAKAMAFAIHMIAKETTSLIPELAEDIKSALKVLKGLLEITIESASRSEDSVTTLVNGTTERQAVTNCTRQLKDCIRQLKSRAGFDVRSELAEQRMIHKCLEKYANVDESTKEVEVAKKKNSHDHGTNEVIHTNSAIFDGGATLFDFHDVHIASNNIYNGKGSTINISHFKGVADMQRLRNVHISSNNGVVE